MWVAAQSVRINKCPHLRPIVGIVKKSVQIVPSFVFNICQCVVWSIRSMQYQIDERITTMNYKYIRPLLKFGIYMQDSKFIYLDAKHATGKY